MAISSLNTLTAESITNGMLKTDKINTFESLLRSTGRQGIEEVITFLKGTDFYSAPSSASYHSNYEGGLLDHSLLVYATACKLKNVYLELKPELASRLDDNSIIISALLHDICKTEFYKPKQKWRKDENDQWVSYDSFEISDSFPIGHGEKSVIMLLTIGLKLTPEEMIAIRFHMGSWDGALLTNDVKYSYQSAINECPLLPLLQTADNTSSLLLETQNKS